MRTLPSRHVDKGHKIAVVHNPPARTAVYNRTVVYEPNVFVHNGGLCKTKCFLLFVAYVLPFLRFARCALFRVYNRGGCVQEFTTGGDTGDGSNGAHPQNGTVVYDGVGS